MDDEGAMACVVDSEWEKLPPRNWIFKAHPISRIYVGRHPRPFFTAVLSLFFPLVNYSGGI
jgi:hypothetical protein